MLMYNICGFSVLQLLSVAIALVMILLVRRHLYDLVNDVVKLPSAAIFYVRVFTISLIFLALSNSVGVSFDLKPDSRFMEYVWKIASGLEETLRYISFFVLGYLVLITILVVVLKRKHE